MVGVVQLVEHQIVVLAVAGSSPVAHPILSYYLIGKPREFLFLLLKIMSGCGAVGSALALGARGRQFESGRPDHFFVCARSSAG